MAASCGAPETIGARMNNAKARLRYKVFIKGRLGQTLWLTARASLQLKGFEKVVVAVHGSAGCPGGQSRKKVLARGGVCVLIHRMNTNKQPHRENY
jgi:hypothetical protein